MITDSHTHLHMHEFKTDREDVIKRAVGAAVGKIITAGVDVETSRMDLEIAQKHPQVFAAVGIQPEEVDQFIGDDLKLKKDFRQDLEKLAEDKKVVAIGEIGLDYKWARGKETGDAGLERQKQIEIFRRQLGLAVTLDLPTVVHCREAEDDVVKEISRYKETKKLMGVIHCFTGTLEFAQKALELGFYISFSGIITFPNAKDLTDVVREIPLDRILVETDSPLIAPQVHRGKRNEPAYVFEVAQKMAEIKGLTLEEICTLTSANARDLFNF